MADESSALAPLEGYVPLPPPEPERKKPGPRKGWKKPAVRDASDPSKFIKTVGNPPTQLIERPACPVCERETSELSMPMVRELVQAAVDRFDVLGQAADQVAVSDVRYLAARLSGFCSLSCWQRRQKQG